MDSSAYIAIAVFVIAYMLIISEKIHRTIVALTGAMVMINYYGHIITRPSNPSH